MERAKRTSSFGFAVRHSGGSMAVRLFITLAGLVLAVFWRRANATTDTERQALSGSDVWAAGVGAVGANLLLFLWSWFRAPYRQRDAAWNAIDVEADSETAESRRLEGIRTMFDDAASEGSRLIDRKAATEETDRYIARVWSLLESALRPTPFKTLRAEIRSNAQVARDHPTFATPRSTIAAMMKAMESTRHDLWDVANPSFMPSHWSAWTGRSVPEAHT